MKVRAIVLLGLICQAGNAELTNVMVNGLWSIGSHTHKGRIGYVHHSGPFKPFVRDLVTPEGVNILRNAPEDHLHHHGLMFAVRVNDINFWEERENAGKQEHVAFGETKRGETLIVQQVQWVGPGEIGPVVNENRKVVFHHVDDFPVTLGTWQSALHGIDGKPAPTYTGTNYNGLGMRFLESMDKGGSFSNADGATGVAGTVGAKSNWCAYTASADGKPVTVAMFDHPTNERHPATWYTMDTPFAYLSATLALDKEPLQKMNLTLTYGVAAWDGTKTKEEVEEMYQRWLKLVEPLVAPTAPAK
ncbi:MAG: PmoA family protein [Candidatus Hydrogenedentes bacterium]|nr:PmoA family protein [Candidatus Hydrogenedentota bacterium]